MWTRSKGQGQSLILVAIELMSALVCTCALSLLIGCGAGTYPTTARTLIIVSPLPPDGTLGAAYGGAQGFSFAASGGATPYLWSWTPATGSALPPGLNLSPDTGTVSGTPTTAGVYSFTISMKDSSPSGNQASLSCVITITSPAALTITSADPPEAILGVPYGGDSGYSLLASGGVAPYTWTWAAAAGSSLPPGLELSTAGVIVGTITTAGSYTFGVTVSDSESSPAQLTSIYTINVNDATGLTITSGTPPSGKVGVSYGGSHLVQGHQFYGFPLSAIGGTPPYTWHWSAGAGSSLPPGLKISVLFWGGSTRCCLSIPVITGIPTTSGTYDVVLRVTDSALPPATRSVRGAIGIQP